MNGYVSMGLEFFALMLRSRVLTRGPVMLPSPSNGKREPFPVALSRRGFNDDHSSAPRPSLETLFGPGR